MKKYKADYTKYTERQIKETIKTANTLIATFGRTPELTEELKRLNEEKANRK